MSGNIVEAYIGLGSNMGNRDVNLDLAINMLRSAKGVVITAVSSYYNTAPVGYTQQPDFLNAVVALETTLSAYELLDLCGDVEKSLKRERIIHWGPRTIDLDILLYGDLILNSEHLTIPHARMHQREFVLKPLNEIAPHVVHPVFEKTINELLNSV